MGLLQTERVLTYPDTPKTILTHRSTYKLTAELPPMEYALQHKIQTPLLERPIHCNRPKGQGFELLLPYKSLTLVIGPYKSACISKEDWPIVSCS